MRSSGCRGRHWKPAIHDIHADINPALQRPQTGKGAILAGFRHQPGARRPAIVQRRPRKDRRSHPRRSRAHHRTRGNPSSPQTKRRRGQAAGRTRRDFRSAAIQKICARGACDRSNAVRLTCRPPFPKLVRLPRAHRERSPLPSRRARFDIRYRAFRSLPEPRTAACFNVPRIHSEFTPLNSHRRGFTASPKYCLHVDIPWADQTHRHGRLLIGMGLLMPHL